MKEVHFNKEAREGLISGINKLNKAVGATMGPDGKTVIIPDEESKIYGQYKITKDGVSVARSIFFKDPLENIGAQLIKQAAEKTVDEAGDGTTTSTVLATAFINNLKDFKTNDINKAFDEIIPKVLEQLKANSRELKHEDIKHVASISANNDLVIGELIQQAYNFSSIIKVEESNNTEDKLELIDGMSLNVSYFSKNFITNSKKGLCELDEPEVLIIDGKLEDLKPFQSMIQRIANEKKSLLIITEHVHDTVLRILESHVLSGNINLCIIKSPGFSKHRQDLLRDLSDFTGATLITDLNKIPALYLGKLKACKISKNSSLLLKDKDIEIIDFIENLKELVKSEDLETYDKELIQQRIENLTAKVSIIKVGGKSELEMKERKDRYDDAVLAVACALEEGIVEGGGEALMWSSLRLNKTYDEQPGPSKYILRSLMSPKYTIHENGLERRTDLSLTGFDLNIIDPLKVTRCALENAVSVAKIILSTEAIVLNRQEWN